MTNSGSMSQQVLTKLWNT